ncbi:hypothetical protein GCM10011583_25310 [Streptomyces camponoticapitis]|uniref:Uncharacterized protein n=1 Tax=Streptomyces camponoticapitis TaxID=1616125 RepID=A0ABQ2E3F8_9ACTN|nr:hypothetical protein GCM10011583_25310 [Streptomyces camponoticapitis]
MVQAFLGPVVVEADDERVAETALVRGMRRPQRRPGGEWHPVVRFRRRLVGECSGEVGQGQVVTRLVGGGEERVDGRVRAVVGEPAGPAAVSAAGKQRVLDGVCRGGVEARQTGVGIAGQRGLLGRCVTARAARDRRPNG